MLLLLIAPSRTMPAASSWRRYASACSTCVRAAVGRAQSCQLHPKSRAHAPSTREVWGGLLTAGVKQKLGPPSHLLKPPHRRFWLGHAPQQACGDPAFQARPLKGHHSRAVHGQHPARGAREGRETRQPPHALLEAETGQQGWQLLGQDLRCRCGGGGEGRGGEEREEQRRG